MATSTVTACEQAILTILTAHTGLTGVLISDTLPTKDEDFVGESVFLGEVNQEEDWGSLGAQRRREEYRIGLTVWVEDWGDTPQVIKTRARTIWNEVLEAFIADLRTGGLLRAAGVQQFNRTTSRHVTGPASPEKWGARLDCQVFFVATYV